MLTVVSPLATITQAPAGTKQAAATLRPFVVRTSEAPLAITRDSHTRDSTQGHTRRRWRPCHQSPPLQLVRPRVQDPSHHLATLELVPGPPRQTHRWWQRSLTPILLSSFPKPPFFPELQPAVRL